MLAITPFSDVDLPSTLAAKASTPAKIISFSDLPVGWHYGEGGPPTSSTIDLAQDLYWSLEALGYTQTDAFPGIHGEVMVTGYWGTRYAELIAEKDDTISIHLERDGDEIYSEEHRPFEEAAAALEHFSTEEDDTVVEGKWSTSDSYTKNILMLTPITTASRVWLLEIPTAAGFQSYNVPASTQGVVQYVNTPASFTLNTSQAIRRSFGNLTNLYFRQEAS